MINFIDSSPHSKELLIFNLSKPEFTIDCTCYYLAVNCCRNSRLIVIVDEAEGGKITKSRYFVHTFAYNVCSKIPMCC